MKKKFCLQNNQNYFFNNNASSLIGIGMIIGTLFLKGPHPKLLSIVIIYNKGLIASVVFGKATIHIFILITTEVGNTRIHL